MLRGFFVREILATAGGVWYNIPIKLGAYGMKILLVNDDGIGAIGIRSLMHALSERHEVWAVAPDRQRSAASMAMTLDLPLRATPAEIGDVPVAGAFAVDGTPVDCARLALGNLVQHPDLVISGINHGPNLGSDTVTERMIGVVNRHPLPFGMFYNVNVPDLPLDEIKGFRVTGLAMVRYNGVYEKREDPLGRPYYWVPRGKLPCDPDEDTDYAWLRKGYVTVTPMGYHSERLDAVDLSDEFGGEA